MEGLAEIGPKPQKMVGEGKTGPAFDDMAALGVCLRLSVPMASLQREQTFTDSLGRTIIGHNQTVANPCLQPSEGLLYIVS
jgi:hypothetical protein